MLLYFVICPLFLFSADVKPSKRRQPFVPYALRNHTGCTMWFATLTTTPTRYCIYNTRHDCVFILLSLHVVKKERLKSQKLRY